MVLAPPRSFPPDLIHPCFSRAPSQLIVGSLV